MKLGYSLDSTLISMKYNLFLDLFHTMKYNSISYNSYESIKGYRMIFNYLRVSTIDQNTSRQLVDVPCDREYIDKASGKDVNRPELKKLLDNVRQGDVINVHSLDRMCRNVKDLLVLMEDLQKKGVTVKFHKENLTFTPNIEDPLIKAIMTIIGAISELERNLILERVREGVAIAKKAGKYKGRKNSLSDIQIDELKSMIGKYNRSQIAKHFGITVRSTYHYAPAKQIKVVEA